MNLKVESLTANWDTHNVNLTPSETFNIFLTSKSPYNVVEILILDNKSFKIFLIPKV